MTTTGLGLPFDRLVRKEVALGLIREFELPQDHIGLTQIAPFMSVESDDVIFDITKGLVAGLAPARAEDAESEMAGKDDTYARGRASIIDWAIKDHYDPSDVSRYRESLLIASSLPIETLPLTVSRFKEGWEEKLARDTARRRKMLDNRMEWLIMGGLFNGSIAYNDGKIKFTVDYGRPANQTQAAPASTFLWSNASSDPIGDIITVQQYMYDTYGVNMNRAIISRRILRQAAKSSKFTNNLVGSNPMYAIAGWGDQAALDFIAQQTGVTFQVYDSVYRTRTLGSTTIVNTRFTPDDTICFLPSEQDVATLDDAIGFAKTLTSPHAEGNFTAGYYEWERDTKDPWSHDMGTGIKAFPVFPHLDFTYTLKVL